MIRMLGCGDVVSLYFCASEIYIYIYICLKPQVFGFYLHDM